VNNKISGFKDLKENWDTYGAEPIHPEAIKLALGIDKVLNDFCAVPTSDGGVQLEKHSKRFDIEIEITVTDKIEL